MGHKTRKGKRQRFGGPPELFKFDTGAPQPIPHPSITRAAQEQEIAKDERFRLAFWRLMDYLFESSAGPALLTLASLLIVQSFRYEDTYRVTGTFFFAIFGVALLRLRYLYAKIKRSEATAATYNDDTLVRSVAFRVGIGILVMCGPVWIIEQNPGLPTGPFAAMLMLPVLLQIRGVAVWLISIAYIMLELSLPENAAWLPVLGLDGLSTWTKIAGIGVWLLMVVLSLSKRARPYFMSAFFVLARGMGFPHPQFVSGLAFGSTLLTLMGNGEIHAKQDESKLKKFLCSATHGEVAFVLMISVPIVVIHYLWAVQTYMKTGVFEHPHLHYGFDVAGTISGILAWATLVETAMVVALLAMDKRLTAWLGKFSWIKEETAAVFVTGAITMLCLSSAILLGEAPATAITLVFVNTRTLLNPKGSKHYFKIVLWLALGLSVSAGASWHAAPPVAVVKELLVLMGWDITHLAKYTGVFCVATKFLCAAMIARNLTKKEESKERTGLSRKHALQLVGFAVAIFVHVMWAKSIGWPIYVFDVILGIVVWKKQLGGNPAFPLILYAAMIGFHLNGQESMQFFTETLIEAMGIDDASPISAATRTAVASFGISLGCDNAMATSSMVPMALEVMKQAEIDLETFKFTAAHVATLTEAQQIAVLKAQGINISAIINSLTAGPGLPIANPVVNLALVLYFNIKSPVEWFKKAAWFTFWWFLIGNVAAFLAAFVWVPYDLGIPLHLAF